jgi:hypothetical protein
MEYERRQLEDTLYHLQKESDVIPPIADRKLDKFRVWSLHSELDQYSHMRGEEDLGPSSRQGRR